MAASPQQSKTSVPFRHHQSANSTLPTAGQTTIYMTHQYILKKITSMLRLQTVFWNNQLIFLNCYHKFIAKHPMASLLCIINNRTDANFWFYWLAAIQATTALFSSALPIQSTDLHWPLQFHNATHYLHLGDEWLVGQWHHICWERYSSKYKGVLNTVELGLLIWIKVWQLVYITNQNS